MKKYLLTAVILVLIVTIVGSFLLASRKLTISSQNEVVSISAGNVEIRVNNSEEKVEPIHGQGGVAVKSVTYNFNAINTEPALIIEISDLETIRVSASEFQSGEDAVVSYVKERLAYGYFGVHIYSTSPLRFVTRISSEPIEENWW